MQNLVEFNPTDPNPVVAAGALFLQSTHSHKENLFFHIFSKIKHHEVSAAHTGPTWYQMKAHEMPLQNQHSRLRFNEFRNSSEFCNYIYHPTIYIEIIGEKKKLHILVKSGDSKIICENNTLPAKMLVLKGTCVNNTDIYVVSNNGNNINEEV